MIDINTILRRIKRPSLLIKAARHGVDDYNRDVQLRRILKVEKLPKTGPAILQLIEIEQSMDIACTENHTTYAISRHVEVLIAIMAEARLLRGLAYAT